MTNLNDPNNYEDDVIDLKRFYFVIKRNLLLIIAVVGLLFIPALLYVTFADPQYTSRTDLLLDKRTTATVSDISSLQELGFETSSIVSEVEVLKSRRVALEASKNLIEQGYFKDNLEKMDENDIINKLLEKVRATRLGETYVLTITFTDTDPKFAADAANAFAEAYIEEQLRALSETSIEGATWLRKKIEELRQESISAQNDVDEYRTKYNSLSQGNLTDNQDAESYNQIPELSLSELRSLEKRAKTYSDLYNSYLEKLGTINLQQSLPITETRIISSAYPPKEKTHPKTLIILGLSIILGAGIGLIVALIKDSIDGTLKRAGQIIGRLNLPFLGFLPSITSKIIKDVKFISNDNKNHNILLNLASIESPNNLYSLLIRNLMNAIETKSGEGNSKIIAVIRDDYHEAQSELAANLAIYNAQHLKCLLIRADIGAKNVSSIAYNSTNTPGIEQVLANNLDIRECILRQHEGNLSLANLSSKDVEKALINVSPSRIRSLIYPLKESYDLIIIDCPPLTNNAFLYSFASLADHAIIVAQWGKTLVNALKFNMSQSSLPADKILGVILENTNISKMHKDYGYKVSQ